MNWLNINTTTLDSPEFLGADPIQRAAWLCLLRYCAGQENGGVITNCAEWKDRQWQQVVRVTLDEVNQPCQLYSWKGLDLVVSFYPCDKETEVKEKRLRAAENGKMGGRPKKLKPPVSPDENPAKSQKKPTLVISAKAEGERERERERNKKENNAAPSSREKDSENLNLIPFPEKTATSKPPPKSGKLRIPDKAADAIRKLYNIRESTRWSEKAVKASQNLDGLSESEILEDVDLMTRARSAGWVHHRKDAETVMNNWQQEISRAESFLSQQQSQTRRPAGINF